MWKHLLNPWRSIPRPRRGRRTFPVKAAVRGFGLRGRVPSPLLTSAGHRRRQTAVNSWLCSSKTRDRNKWQAVGRQPAAQRKGRYCGDAHSSPKGSMGSVLPAEGPQGFHGTEEQSQGARGGESRGTGRQDVGFAAVHARWRRGKPERTAAVRVALCRGSLSASDRRRDRWTSEAGER